MNILTIGIILISLRLLASIFFKTDYSRIYCGIFAFAGFKNITKGQIDLAITKFKILGLYNDSRGGDGCGTYTNSEIIKGIDKQKHFDSFIEANDLPRPEVDGNRVMIGHCRKASRGLVKLDNTHPFLINNDMVICHNGTLTNCYELNNKYGFKYLDWDVDSQLLGMILEQGHTDVLEQYEGYAALVWSRLSTPNVIHVYHGKSKETKNGIEIEERPLYVMQEEEGFYFSSMSESLLAIQDGDEPINTLKHNHIFTIEDGILVDEKTIAIDRTNKNVKVSYYGSNNNTQYSRGGSEDWYDSYGGGYEGGSTMMSSLALNKGFVKNEKGVFVEASTIKPNLSLEYVKINADPSYIPKSWREVPPIKISEKAIYYHKGRFHTPDGNLVQGCIYLLKQGYISDSSSSHAKPVYFFDGVLIEKKEDYVILRNMQQAQGTSFKHPNRNFALFISEYSQYPVTNYNDESTTITREHRYKWYLNKKHVNKKDNFTPKYAKRNYIFDEDGYLELITYNDKGSKSKPAIFAEVKEEKIFKESKVPFEYNNSFSNDMFDEVFESIEAANLLLDEESLQAICLFVRDHCIPSNDLDQDQDEIQEIVMSKLNGACNSKKSIREYLHDSENNYLNYYYDLVIENGLKKDEDYIHSKLQALEDSEIDDDSIEDASFTNLEDKEDKQKENNKMLEIISKLEDVIDNFADIMQQSDDLTAINDPFADDVANLLYRKVEEIKHGMADLCRNNQYINLLDKINKLNTNS